MKDSRGAVIYVGKASSLKKRVNSYFTKAHDAKTAALVASIKTIDHIATDSVLEATFLEAELIKNYQPKYNIELKDDKSFIYLVVTKDAYPKLLLVRGHEVHPHTQNAIDATGNGHYRKSVGVKQEGERAIFGPFTSAELLRSLLKLVRKIFPWSNCRPPAPSKKPKPCFYYHLGQCPGICVGKISAPEYRKTIANLILFFKGKKKRVLQNLKKQMTTLGKQEKFEEAAQIRNQLFNLEHLAERERRVGDAYHPSRKVSGGHPKGDMRPLPGSHTPPFHRIEGYDISNISGTAATGSMVVFENGESNKAEYRRFKIKTIEGANDVGMLKEVLTRRFRNDWTMPDLILIDGGVGHVNAAKRTLHEHRLSIPVVGMAKGNKRKRTDLILQERDPALIKAITDHKNLLIRVRDEAHRFALAYHRHLRAKSFAHR